MSNDKQIRGLVQKWAATHIAGSPEVPIESALWNLQAAHDVELAKLREDLASARQELGRVDAFTVKLSKENAALRSQLSEQTTARVAAEERLAEADALLKEIWPLRARLSANLGVRIEAHLAAPSPAPEELTCEKHGLPGKCATASPPPSEAQSSKPCQLDAEGRCEWHVHEAPQPALAPIAELRAEVEYLLGRTQMHEKRLDRHYDWMCDLEARLSAHATTRLTETHQALTTGDVPCTKRGDGFCGHPGDQCKSEPRPAVEPCHRVIGGDGNVVLSWKICGLTKDHVGDCAICPVCNDRGPCEAGCKDAAPDVNCVTAPDGDCVSTGECMHTPAQVAPKEAAPVVRDSLTGESHPALTFADIVEPPAPPLVRHAFVPGGVTVNMQNVCAALDCGRPERDHEGGGR